MKNTRSRSSNLLQIMYLVTFSSFRDIFFHKHMSLLSPFDSVYSLCGRSLLLQKGRGKGSNELGFFFVLVHWFL